MDIFEITGYQTGVDNSGVTFLNPADAFDSILNGFIYRQVLQSRLGFSRFANRIADETRIMGIFENVNPQDSTLQLLVCSKQFLYRYDGGTNSFIQIPMAGSAPIGGFGITNNEDYVSGISYADKNNQGRFIFCSRGMSDIYYYNGVSVYSFTQDTGAHDGVNNDFTNPPGQILTKATYVEFFGNRLNFFMPVLNAVQFPQAVLYSAVRDASGNGDKFNQPGAGQLGADTFEIMKGTNVLGDFMIINFQRSNWTIQKTGNAFNPYFFRKVPSVLGTDASFSDVSWAYEVKSVGKTGLITTDGRQSLRFDNKVPYFTEDLIDQSEFELTYGGFDRQNEQFMFAYRSNASPLTDITQDKVLIYNYKEETFSINDQRFSVFGQSDAGANLVMNDIDETQDSSWGRMDTTEEVWDKIGIEATVQKTLAGDNLGFIYQINTDFDDYLATISAITQAGNAMITIEASAYMPGDRVIFENIGGMVELNGQIGTVLSRTDTSLTVDLDTTLYTPYTSGGVVSKTIQFEATMSPFNPYRKLGNKVYLSHIEFLLNTNAGSVTVDIYEDEEQAPFKSAKLVPSQTTTKAKEWITISVNSEANFMTMVLSNESSGSQTLITSVRIHCSIGGFTTS